MFIKEMYPWVGLVWPVARATSSFWAFTWTGIACSGASGNGSNGAYSATDDKTVMERCGLEPHGQWHGSAQNRF